MAAHVVVIGAGVAGLYAACKLSDSHRVTVLERDTTLGGRAKVDKFKNVQVPTGAGIGRKAKDVRLQSLLRRLKVPVKEFTVMHHALFPCTARRTFEAIKAAFEESVSRPYVSFRTFATAVVGNAEYLALVACSGYSDFEDADVADVLYHYGFEDNITDWAAFSVPWSQMIAAMEAWVKRSGGTIVRKCAATKLTHSRTTGQYFVDTNKGVFEADKVVVATDIDTVRSLLPHMPVYKHIHGQPFIRIYAAVSKHSAKLLQDVVKGVTIVRGPLQKIIPMSGTVFMVAYSDNASALYIRDNAVHKTAVARLLEDCLGLPHKSVHINAIRCYYHAAGTHYNDSGLHKHGYSSAMVQRPLPNVFVVGEAVSNQQGWVEGALESVDQVI